jgi:uncharacterized protein (DUF58 family)
VTVTSRSKLEPIFSPKIMAQLELLQIHSRRAFLSVNSGSHVSLKRGHGIEFADYSSYQLGDDLRHIDWNVYARSERLFVKRFREEQDLQIGFVLDNSPSMHTSANNQKWQACLDLSLALAYISIMQHDCVHFALPGKLITPACKQVTNLNQIAQKLKEIESTKPESFKKDLASYIDNLRYPGMAFFVSDFLYDQQQLTSIIKLFLAKNIDLVCIQVLSAEEQDLTALGSALTLVDSETEEEQNISASYEMQEQYLKALKDHQNEIKKICLRNNIHLITVDASADLMTTLNQGFLKKGLVRYE